MREKIHYNRCLSDNAAITFREGIPLVFSLSHVNSMEGGYLNFPPTQVGDLVDSAAASLRTMLWLFSESR